MSFIIKIILIASIFLLNACGNGEADRVNSEQINIEENEEGSIVSPDSISGDIQSSVVGVFDEAEHQIISQGNASKFLSRATFGVTQNSINTLISNFTSKSTTALQ